MNKTKNSKSFFGYKTKEKRKNKKIGYAFYILLPIGSKVIAGTHTHTHDNFLLKNDGFLCQKS